MSLSLCNNCFLHCITEWPLTKNEIDVFWTCCCRNSRQPNLFSLWITTNYDKIKTSEFGIWFLVTSWSNERNKLVCLTSIWMFWWYFSVTILSQLMVLTKQSILFFSIRTPPFRICVRPVRPISTMRSIW